MGGSNGKEKKQRKEKRKGNRKHCRKPTQIRCYLKPEIVEDTHPMVAAILRHDCDAICELVRRGFDLEERICSLGTALHLAAAFGTVRTVKLVLDLGADAGAANQKGDSPLELAVSSCCEAGEKVVLLSCRSFEMGLE